MEGHRAFPKCYLLSSFPASFFDKYRMLEVSDFRLRGSAYSAHSAVHPSVKLRTQNSKL